MAPRGLGSFLMMPLVGTVLGKFDPRKVLAVGLVGASWSLYALSKLNLQAGYWDIFWPQFIQGACLALLFVPLTTATMDPIPKEEMGNATSMFNLMRNLGGSVGIACGTTFLFRRQQFHTHLLGANVTPFNPAGAGVCARHSGRDDGPRRGSRHRRAPVLRRHLGHGAAAGGHGGVHRHVPRHGSGVPAGDPAALPHEEAETPSAARRPCTKRPDVILERMRLAARS